MWRESELFQELRGPQTGGACVSCSHYDACRGGCMAAKFFTGLPLDGPDPECVLGHGESLLDLLGDAPRSRAPAAGPLAPQPPPRPDRACDESPLAGLRSRRLTKGDR